MKKTIITLLIFLPFLLNAQPVFQPVLKSYFRTHPFDGTFSAFIKSLQQDPWFKIEEYSRRTDTSFFFLTGTYKNFNPFHYPAKEVRLIVAEQLLEHTDSLKTLDTIINIQLLGIADATENSRTEVVKEYTRFQKKYASLFWKSSYQKGDYEGRLATEINHFFIYPYSISPISVVWGHMETKEYAFIITIRCKVKQNIADVILNPGEAPRF